MDRLENNLANKATVLRLDITTPLGRHAAAQFGVRGVPTLIVVDGEGQPVLTQLALIRPGPVEDQIDLLSASH